MLALDLDRHAHGVTIASAENVRNQETMRASRMAD
jgi:hypothetical protein